MDQIKWTEKASDDLKNNDDIEILTIIYCAREIKPLFSQDWELS
jgi:hypothetical protein